ncbi:glycolipid transport [Seminavis robusta]|uniref:Glycolipid transport n=1 Tax=Seminavis robusta TaxID=568900 RepID=A0A9N8HWV0_9STRA|nr:glycolipid transport [Seminavis robusta]|eukprot:Sro1703_g292300.1 glycolipid transport (272) ;mRNA; f:12330-13145
MRSYPLSTLLLVLLLASLADGTSFWSSIRGGGSVATRSRSPPLVIAEDQRRRATSNNEIVSTKLERVVKGFQKVVPRKDIHVGKLLAAFKQMQAFLQDTGMNQAANTLSTNIAKIEDSHRRAPAHERENLSALLRYEIDSGVHQSRGLAENSAAMGVVWLCRNLSYQRSMYQLMLEANKTPLEAAQLAFQKELRPHLHWTVANVLLAAIKSLTPANHSAFFSKIGGFPEKSYGPDEERATRRDVQRMIDLWQPILTHLGQVFHDLELQGRL